MSSRIKMLFFLHSNALLWGFVPSLLGLVITLIIEDFSLSYTQGGKLFSISAIGSTIGSFTGGILADSLNRQKLLQSILLILLFVFGSLTLVPNYEILLVVVAAGGVTGGIFNIILNTSVGDLYSEKRAAAFNLLNVSFGLGSVLAPAYTLGILKISSEWRSVYVLVPILFGLILLLSFQISLPKKKPTVNRIATINSYILILRDYREIICAIIVLLAAGTEWAFAYWVVTYMYKGLGISYEIATNALSLFWIGMILGRFVMSRILSSLNPFQVIRFSTLAAIFMAILVTLKTTPVFSVLSVGVFGLFLSGILPTCIGLMMDRHPEKSASVSGLLLVASGIGAIFVPVVVGFISDNFGLTWGMRLIPALLTVSLILIVCYKPS